MEVILLSKLERLGDLGDVVRVKPGYARNYLIPYGKAKLASKENVLEFERRKAELAEKAAQELELARKRRELLHQLRVTVVTKVSDEGSMFGSVGIPEIVEAVQQACGEKIEKHEVVLPDGPLREIGIAEVSLKLHSDMQAVIELNVVPDRQI